MRTPTLLALSACKAGPGRAGRGALAFALGLWLCGCPESPPPEPSPDMRLEVGTGQQEFTPLADGDTLLIHRGCQGSQHTYVSLRSWGLPSDPVIVELALTRTEDGTKVSSKFRVRYLFAQSASEELPDTLPGLLLPIPDPSAAVGRSVRLTASVELDSGATVTDARTGTLQWGDPACP